MNFVFSPEQELFREQVRRYLEKSASRSVVRKVMEGDGEALYPLWRGLGELGALAVTIDEEYGGLGLGALELCVVAEEVGRALAPVPFLTSIGLAAEAIQLHGTSEHKSRWLPRLASAEIIGTAVLSTTDDIRFRDGTLQGVAIPVLDGLSAGLVVVPSTDNQGEFVALICDLSQTNIERELVDSIDPSRPVGRIRFNKAEATILPGLDQNAWRSLVDRAAILLAFEQLGGAEAAMMMARDYVLERSAFGRKVGSFQAVKHRLADLYVSTELARGHCYYGAWALSAESDLIPRAAAGARCSATEAMEFAAQELIQLHGGIGVTWEADCQFFYRRARMNALLLGSTHQWQDRLVETLAK